MVNPEATINARRLGEGAGTVVDRVVMMPVTNASLRKVYLLVSPLAAWQDLMKTQNNTKSKTALRNINSTGRACPI